METARHFFLAACLLSCGCQRENSGPIAQRGYLWQRDWTPATEKAFQQAQSRFDGVIILGGEILWDGTTPHLVKSSIRWEIVTATQKPTALALRIAPFAGRFDSDDGTVRSIVEIAKSLLAEAAEHHASISEFQLDFDCPQKKLAGYREWLHSLGAAIRPMPFSITVLPSWLDESEFVRLLREVDSYVLQVHSVPARGENGKAVLCDPRTAKSWTAKAARLGRPFSVALPTYRCLAGYDAQGKLLGVAMDSVQPAWPRDTRVLEFGADAEQLAHLVADWKRARPPMLRELIWYRVPIETDARNWHWPTLSAVVNGRVPEHRLAVASEGENPIDLVLVNDGEAEEQFGGEITADWDDATLVSSDALAGWTLHAEGQRAVFTSHENALRLSPGERRVIGWLRYDRRTQPRFTLAPPRATTR